MCIIKILGTPDADTLASMDSDEASEFIMMQPKHDDIDFTLLLPNAPPLAIDLLTKMLMFDPKERCSVQEALKHPYLDDLFDPDVDDKEPSPIITEDANYQIPNEFLKSMVYSEIESFHT
ncbi:mitogen-activated protein kinase MAPK [Acrasis kona]|uniref:Mitogen-activated protein kinase MAPK n=1 Tax=Acrasis kona TaxID=1008807 RepID=A0AAW2ZF77_9EUKA